MRCSARTCLSAFLVLTGLAMCGCSALFTHITFKSTDRLQAGQPTNYARASVINHKRSWLAFGPPLIPIVPWPTGVIPQLSYWRQITVGIHAINPTEPLILDLSDAALVLPGQRGRPPVSIDAKCVGPAAERTDHRITLPPASHCIVYLDFGLSPDAVEEFDLALGTVLIDSEAQVFPVSHHVKHCGLDYRALTLPLL